ncbi:MAG TPA: alpha amylase C-terminal domain-containing protein [Candidatus Limnocylindria bacterium]|nr:alpha amylase C-terminal domain-containing protein [Candidatus Limnocylindria bacterium]
MPTQPTPVPGSVPMGANIVPDRSGATFRCWAPRAKSVAVRGEFNNWGTTDDGLLHHDGDYWSGFVPGAHDGQQYKFYVVGEGSEGYKRDPYARELTRNPAYPFCHCILQDPRSWTWHDEGYHPPGFNDLIIYQLHVGVFNGPNRPTRVAKFLDVLGKLDYLAALGINALLLLPIVEVASGRSLGYEGFDIFSPEMDYGAAPGPELQAYLGLVNGLRGRFGLPALSEVDLELPGDQLKAFVDLCHLHGLAVLLDVVYNHAGGQMKGQSESLWMFDRPVWKSDNDSLYFTDQDHTGPVWAIWKQEVRQYLIDNAVFFLQEYHVDGFRYDHASVIVQSSASNGWRFCQDLTSTVRLIKPGAINIAEYWGVDPYVVRFRENGGAGFDACWHDGLRHSLRDAASAASGCGLSQVSLMEVAKNLWAPNFLNAWRAVQYVESHDEVYRDRGQRIPKLADGGDTRSWYARSRSRVISGILMLAPGIPMVFMGQSFLEDKQWADDAGNYPGLLLWWDGLDFGKDPHMGRFHRFMEELIRLRRTEPALRSDTLSVLHANDENRILAFQRWLPGIGRDVVVVASLNDHTFPSYELPWPGAGNWREIFNSDAYEDYPANGNGGGVTANWAPKDGQPASALILIPSNSVLVFAR